jgi:general secretion pathway protein G
MAGGFSLLEMVIVLGIIALILGAAITFSGGITGAAREQAAEAKMREISAKLEAYHLSAGMYPTETQGLQALVERPTTAPEPKRWKRQFRTLPTDPWNEEFLYKNPGSKDPKTYEIISKGEDRELNTDDDISSQELE